MVSSSLPESKNVVNAALGSELISTGETRPCDNKSNVWIAFLARAFNDSNSGL